MNLYSFMLINKDASRIYSTTLSSKQFLCAYVCVWLSIHFTTLLQGKYRVVFLRDTYIHIQYIHTGMDMLTL